MEFDPAAVCSINRGPNVVVKTGNCSQHYSSKPTKELEKLIAQEVATGGKRYGKKTKKNKDTGEEVEIFAGRWVTESATDLKTWSYRIVK